MQIRISKKYQSGCQGYALAITLLFLAVSLIIFSSIFYWTSANRVLTQRNNQYNMSQEAAEAATERVLGQMDRDFIYQSLGSGSSYATLPASIDQSAWPVQYTYTDTNGVANQISVWIGPVPTQTVQLNSQYSGLYGLEQDCTLTAIASPVSQPQSVPATVQETLQFALIPLFQFAIFYNVNLEIAPGQPMTISGPVFCNQSIWEGANYATFTSTVTAVGTNCMLKNDPFALNYGPQTPPPTFTLSGQPATQANALVMPIGTNNNPSTILGLLNLPPAAYYWGSGAEYSSNGIVYPANGADLVISNNASGTNFYPLTLRGTNTTIWFQDSSMVQIPYDFYIVTNRTLHTNTIVNCVPTASASNILFAGYSFVTNAVFFDWREGWNGGAGPAKRVQALQIDISKLNSWLTNNSTNSLGQAAGGFNYNLTKSLHTGHNIDSVYAYNSVPLTSSTLPAVRVANGSQLFSSSGFTVATPFPMYVLGNYNVTTNGVGSSLGTNNTAYTYPAALMADAVTILSANWNDSVTTMDPSPGSTTVNAAMLEGIVASNPAISGNYSGGVENFLRLLENWSGSTLTYNGSIVVLFYSQYATNSWNGGGYYGVPTRHWAFDLNFANSSKLPPLTPSTKAMIRGNSSYY